MTTMTTEIHLLEKHGPLMTLDALAHLLDRSVGGIRLGLRTNAPWALQLNRARRKVGKRVYFRTVDVAKLVDGETA